VLFRSDDIKNLKKLTLIGLNEDQIEQMQGSKIIEQLEKELKIDTIYINSVNQENNSNGALNEKIAVIEANNNNNVGVNTDIEYLKKQLLEVLEKCNDIVIDKTNLVGIAHYLCRIRQLIKGYDE